MEANTYTSIVVLGITLIGLVVAFWRGSYPTSWRYKEKLEKKAKLTCAGCLGGVVFLEKRDLVRAVYRPQFTYKWELRKGLCEDCYLTAARIRTAERELNFPDLDIDE